MQLAILNQSRALRSPRFLMVFQGSLLAGFLRSASRLVDSIDASLWVTAHGARSFDFATPLPADFARLRQNCNSRMRVRCRRNSRERT